MKTNLLSFLAGWVVLSSAANLTYGQELDPGEYPEPAESNKVINETPELWFVELASLPAADGTSLTTLLQEKDRFRRSAKRAGLKFTERYAFNTLWNGLSIRIQPAQLPALTRIEGVKAIYPVERYSLPRPNESIAPDLAHAIAMTGADVAQNTLGLTGAGVKVGIIDSGLDYDHPDFGGNGANGSTPFPTARVIAGFDFVGDDYDSMGDPEQQVPVPDDNPDDCNGHGTHVAGIVGANGAATGVAPHVFFGAYRVFGCDGSSDSDVVIAAMERALADGMQVINMSLGSAFDWPTSPTAQASDRLVNKGVVVVASIGNSGPNGVYSAGAPGIGHKVIGVASFDNSHVQLRNFTVSPDDKAIGYSPAATAPEAPRSGSFPMARTGTSTSPADACDPMSLPAGLAGKVVLIRRGTCTFYQKALNAQNAGAVAVVIYNNAPGRFAATVAPPEGAPPITIPVVTISDAEGVLINNRLAVGPVTLTWTDQSDIFRNPTAGLISSFSSYGMAPDLTLKPDIGAPGGLIRSTFPIEQDSYAVLSGTSMSSPHVAGAVALLLEALPHTPSPAVRSILQNNADPRPWWGNPGLGFRDNVHRQGAGMLDIDDAILATARIDPSKLALGESETGPATRTLTVKNQGAADVTFDLGHLPALSTGGNTFNPGFFAGFAAVSFTVSDLPVSTLTVPARGSASVDVTISANPALPNRSQYGGYIVFTPQGGGQPYRVPYAGLKGDYQSIVVLTPTPAGFPLLAKLTMTPGGPGFVFQPAGATFTLEDDDLPFILVHLEHQSRRLRMEVFNAHSGKSFHRAFEFQFLPRNATSAGFFALPWDGLTVNGLKVNKVPDGDYVIKLSVLKPLGDDANPAHWETWTSPVITIDRP